MVGAWRRGARTILHPDCQLSYQPSNPPSRRQAFARRCQRRGTATPDERNRTVSVFDGPAPEIRQLDSVQAEIGAVSGWITRVPKTRTRFQILTHWKKYTNNINVGGLVALMADYAKFLDGRREASRRCSTIWPSEERWTRTG